MGLGDPDVVLELTAKCNVPAGTSLHQTDDGTLFYYKYQNPQRLYVKWNDEELDVTMPDGNEIIDIAALLIHGNYFYFLNRGKINRAEFTKDNTFVATIVRDRFEGETITFGGMCSRVEDGMKFVYRMCDDPDEDVILIDIPQHELEGLELRGIHRGKAIFLNTRSGREPSAMKLGELTLAIQCLRCSTPLLRDSSRFIYIANQDCLFALDSENALFRPVLSFGDHPIRTIVSVIDDVLTVRGRKDGVGCLMTAKLPEGYFDDKKLQSVTTSTSRI